MIETQNKALDAAAKRYEADGYTIKISPNVSELPETLRGFHPDLIAARSDRHVFFEMRLPGRVRRVDYWRELSEALQKLSDWHLELQVTQEPQFVEIAGKEEIQDLQEQSRLLINQGSNNAALLVAWAALEAAARHGQKSFAADDAISKPLPSNKVVAQLYENGLLDRPDYEFLRGLAQQRNAAAHGFQYAVNENDLNRIIEIVETLLAE